MPQLVKGGKYVFGWTVLNEDFKIRIPDEAYDEYELNKTEKLIIISGSKTSGGISITSPHRIINSGISNILRSLEYSKDSDEFFIKDLKIVKSNGRSFCWTYLSKNKQIILSKDILIHYNLEVGRKMLAVRGSGIGPGLITRGLIYDEALKHPDLLVYE